MDIYVEMALEEGVEQVLCSLEMETGKSVALWREGHLVWPKRNHSEIERELPYWLPVLRKEEYYYRLQERCLYFCYGSHAGNIIELAEASEDEIGSLDRAVSARREALELFEAVAGRADRMNDDVQQKMFGKLLHSSAKIQEIFNLYGIELSTDKPGRILLGRCRAGQVLSAELFEQLKKHLPSVLSARWKGPILWEGRILWYFSPELDWKGIGNRAERWSAMAQKQGMELSWGLGSVYEWKELHRSFWEAGVAWSLGMLRDRKPLCVFAELGIEKLLFSQGLPELKAYVRQTFGNVWRHDREENQQLFETLCRMVRHDFSISKTAEEMYLHANTIRYRCRRLEAVLGAPLDSYHTRGNLISALAVWEVMTVMELMDKEYNK